ncbi:MAG: sugar-binding protein, partial [Eubacteriales bacterium]|nr:sugar-binding protein [Eubacteriales bacterium]
MKKFMTIFVIMTVLCTIFTIYGSAIAGGEDYGSVPYTYNILALDAIKEDTYTHALHINGNLERDGGSINAGADYWLIYDDTYLWMFVEIKDSTLNTAADDELTSSYKVDSIEIMLDFTNKGENIVDETPYQCRVDHQGFVSGRIGQGGTSLFGTPAQGGDVDFFESAA